MIDILRLLKRKSGLTIGEITAELKVWPIHIVSQSINWLLENIIIDEYQNRYFYRQLYRAS